MVAEPWILKMGNQVSQNLKHALLLESSSSSSHKKKNMGLSKRAGPDTVKEKDKRVRVGILSFEVANVMSKIVHLHKSLADSEISKLKAEILKSVGVRNLVSGDESYLLELALAEKLDDLNRVAGVVSRLGKKCVEPALQGFEHVYGDIISGVIDVKELGFLVKDMEGMVRKMERYVNATCNLYSELEVLNELEQATKKFQQNQHEESRKAFEQKVIWQKQDVRHLKEISIWNQTFDKAVELLVRTVCTIYARICMVFGEFVLKQPKKESLGNGGGSSSSSSPSVKDEAMEVSGNADEGKWLHAISGPLRQAANKRSSHSCQSGPIERMVEKRETGVKPGVNPRRGEVSVMVRGDAIFPCVTSPGRLFTDCLSLTSSASKFDDDVDDSGDYEDRRSQVSCSGSIVKFPVQPVCSNRPQAGGVSFGGDYKQTRCSMMNYSARHGPKSRLMAYAPPSTVGGSALALHYANVIIVIEKLLRYPHLVGEEARDDLYQMLPTSLRMSLRTNLKSYMKNLAIYDAPLAHDWKETLEGILRWLVPLAHNMIRWQSERNFEQHQIVARSNVLLLQTLYFAERRKTESAVCELLVGLNYICRYEQQQNALLDCASSFDFEDCMQWQMQCRASYTD